MKKALYILTAVLLIGVVITGCGKKETPFEPSTDSFNATQAMESQGPTVLSINTRDLDNTLYEAPTYDEIVILFDADMNGGTINTGTILLQNVENLAAVMQYTVTYDAGSKKAVIKSTSGWDDDLSYLVTVTTGVKDIHGHALDGNGNDWVDPQDFYREQFWGYTAAVGNYDMTPPTIGIGNPSNNEFWFSLSDSIIITISDNDSVNRASITEDDFVLTNAATGQVVAMPAMFVEESSAPATYIVRFRPLSTVLKDSNDYFLTVKTSITDMKGNSLDGDADGDAENEFIDRERVKFRTYDPRNGGGVPNFYGNLRVFEARYVDNNRGLEIRFNHKMNPAYLNSNYIKIYNDANYEQYVPGTLTILPDSFGVRYSLENFDGSGYLWVSRTVKDTAGLYLDQNNNGIPGEAAYTTGPSAYQPGDDLLAAVAYNSGLAMVLFQDNAEGSNAGWTLRGTTPQLWHHSTRRLWTTGYGGKFAWHCGVDADSSYLVTGPTAVHDTIMMPTMDLTVYNIYANARIYFTYWYRTDGGADACRLIASTDNGASWATIATYSGNSGGWNQTNPTVTGYLGSKVRFAFAFDTDNVGNVYPSEGFYFDNFLLYVY